MISRELGVTRTVVMGPFQLCGRGSLVLIRTRLYCVDSDVEPSHRQGAARNLVNHMQVVLEPALVALKASINSDITIVG